MRFGSRVAVTEGVVIQATIVMNARSKGVQITVERGVLSHDAVEIKRHVDHVVGRVATKGKRRVLHGDGKDKESLSSSFLLRVHVRPGIGTRMG